ncbi:MAG: methyltransferase domain-containing protein [Verrucomicrobiae bacterium]|nr:methyltransferase domain-containing protein [Verrucomicrobiae bacterium]
MSASAWEDRYRSGETPWEKGSGAPGLIDFLDHHPSLPRGTVLIPGCGTGHDVRSWARHGFASTGLDLAPSAIRRCCEAPSDPAWQIHYSAGDFLGDQPSTRYGWVFEHTLFCAIPPADRDRYVLAVRRWLQPGGHFLAIHYMLRDDGDGPPFGCTQEELMERFTPHFELLRGWIPRSYPNRTGLELMLWWRHRPAPSQPI